MQMEWRPAGWSVCLPLLIFPCTIKSRSSLLAPADPSGPGKRAIKRLCVCVCVCNHKGTVLAQMKEVNRGESGLHGFTWRIISWLLFMCSVWNGYY